MSMVAANSGSMPDTDNLHMFVTAIATATAKLTMELYASSNYHLSSDLGPY